MAAVEGPFSGDGGLALLQKALGDERARSDQHKQNYEQLKTQLTQIQERYSGLEKQYQQSLEDGQAMQTKAKAVIQQLQSTMRDKNGEMEELKSQVLTPEREELLRLRIASEQEQAFLEKLCAAEYETDRYRNEFNSLRYDHAVLQSEYESEQKRLERVVDEMRLKFDADRNRLQLERDDATAHCLKVTETDGENKRLLSRENFKLQNRVKSLLEEVADEKAKKDEATSKLETSSRKQAQQMADAKAKTRALETEKASLAQQLKMAQDEIENLSKSGMDSQAKIYDLEKACEAVKSKKEEHERQFKRDLNGFQIDMVKLKGDHLKEKDELNNRISILECELGLQKEKVAKKIEEVLEKEREGEKKLAELREEEWKEKQKREDEKIELERKVIEAERKVTADKEKWESEKEKIEDEKIKLDEDKRDLERENAAMKRDVKDKEKTEEQLEQAHKQTEAFREKIVILSKGNAELKLNLETSQVENEKLTTKTEMYCGELETVNRQLIAFRNGTEKYANKLKRDREVGMAALSDKYDKVLKANHEIKKTADHNAAVYQKQKQKYLKAIRHFKQCNALLKAESEEMKALNENLGNNVPADVHFALKNKMKDMMKRHAEFQSLLLYAGPEGSQCSPHALPLNPSPSVLGTHMDDPNVFTSARQRRPTATASNPNPILRNPLTSTPISKRKTKSAARARVALSSPGGIRSLGDLKDVQHRVEKLQETQQKQDEEIEKHLKSDSSPEILMVDAALNSKPSTGLSFSSKQKDLSSSLSSLSEKKDSKEENYSSDSFSEDKENEGF